jgi:DNA-directed RNA polymerase subunit K/omega
MADFDEEISVSGSDSDDNSDIEEISPVKPKIKILGPVADDESEDDEEEDEEEEPIDNTFDSDDENEDKYILRTLSEDDDEDRKQKRKLIGLNDEEDEEDEDEEDDDENYLQKFDESLKNNVIEKHHPELIMHNHQEVEAMCHIVRDNNGNIVDPLHRTLPFITKFEKARILGERAKQINAGAHAMVAVDEDMIDGYLIALKEYDEQKIPIILRRPLPNGGCEYWKLKDLELIV